MAGVIRNHFEDQDKCWQFIEFATTPPIPSSSPGPLDERMDISPLPHKQPYNAQIQIQSPTPQPQDEDMGMESSPPRPVEAPRPTSGFE